VRVLYDHQIFSSQPQGGVSRYFSELLKHGPAAGVEACCGWRFTSNRYLQEWDPARFHDWWPSVSFKGKAHITGFLNRGRSMDDLKSDPWQVFHPTYFDPYFLPRLGGRPFVLTIHDMTHELHPEGLSDRDYLPARKRLLAHRARKVIAVSENTRQDAIRLLGLDPEKVVTIHHGNSLRPGVIKPIPAPWEPGYWLFVGSRADYKNWSLVIEALGSRGRPSDRLVLVGGGPLTAAENRFLAQAGLSGRVFQTSATDGELAGWYQGAAALVYPSLYEGFGMPLLEAMAWGCPVVAAQTSCLPEVAGEAALYFDPRSPAELRAAMDGATDPGRREALIGLGIVRESVYSWDRAAAETFEVYREVVR
jgi:glycosyltransferase involved in cell wall biosynthesis